MNFPLSSHRYKKITGVSFPAESPRDFNDQVRVLVRNHNMLVEDLLTFQATVREFQEINKELENQLNLSQKENLKIRDEYAKLKTISEKLATKHEALLSRSNNTISKNNTQELQHQSSRDVSSKINKSQNDDLDESELIIDKKKLKSTIIFDDDNLEPEQGDQSDDELLEIIDS